MPKALCGLLYSATINAGAKISLGMLKSSIVATFLGVNIGFDA